MNDGFNGSPWHRNELTYCSNVHPAETYQDLKTVVTGFINEVRKRRNATSMGAGLWINQSVAAELVDQPEKLHQLAALLKSNHIDLFTLNGFPYGNFHGLSVKEQVYTPDWSEPERLQYTQHLAEILSHCLPDTFIEGTISTLPLGFRHTWDEHKQKASLKALCQLAEFLGNLKLRTGRKIRVCLEMEPDCVLETTDELIDFFRNHLPRKASSLGIQEQTLSEHLGICFDVCHQAVMFENCAESLARINAADIAIGKIQVSSALAVAEPARREVRGVLEEFVEPRYLHQVRTRGEDCLLAALDLPKALTEQGLSDVHPWHIHFHVPIQADVLAQSELGTTQGAILDTLDFLKNNPLLRPHLEIETYTWQVLPDFLRPKTDSDLIRGLTDELDWLESEMSKRGLIR